MKSLLTSLLLFLPFTLFAEDVIVSAKVSDRARNGAAIRGQFKYPVVELESGETASVHIGEVLRYPVWMETVEVDETQSAQQMWEETLSSGTEMQGAADPGPHDDRLLAVALHPPPPVAPGPSRMIDSRGVLVQTCLQHAVIACRQL